MKIGLSQVSWYREVSFKKSFNVHSINKLGRSWGYAYSRQRHIRIQLKYSLMANILTSL